MQKQMDLSKLECQKKPCRTCPFAGSEPIQLNNNRYRELIENLLGNGQHLCHSSKKEKICRGGRDIQLRWLTSIGALKEASDEAFNEAIAKAKP